jgi:hypothetical protein
MRLYELKYGLILLLSSTSIKCLLRIVNMRYLSFIAGILVATMSDASPTDDAGQQGKWTLGQTVKTTSGSIQGHATSNATEVSEYLGIPYAFPPVGRLRFQPPIRYHGKETINGSNFVSKS